MARFTANPMYSGSVTIPGAMAVNDELLFNVTGRGSHGVIVRFRFPVPGNYRVLLRGGNGTEGSLWLDEDRDAIPGQDWWGTRPLPNNIGGNGAIIQANISFTASENILLVI